MIKRNQCTKLKYFLNIFMTRLLHVPYLNERRIIQEWEIAQIWTIYGSAYIILLYCMGYQHTCIPFSDSAIHVSKYVSGINSVTE